MLAGHSLGSIVALTLVGLAPGYCDCVVVEDPPGLGGSLDLRDVADGVEEFVRVARADPAGTVAALLEENPMLVARASMRRTGQEPADARRGTGCRTTEER